MRLQKALLGFAAGVMIAAAVWSLLIPAMEMSAAALALSAGIAIQNVPEGAIVSALGFALMMVLDVALG